jgi:hypothetical protein
VIKGGVKYASFNDIKRTATFTIVDDGSINFLSDRIQPIMSLKIPTIKRVEKVKVRYIRDFLSGNNKNTQCHWVEIQAYDKNGVNIALGKTVTPSSTPSGVAGTLDPQNVTDGNLNTYVDLGTNDNVIVDLGATYDIESVTIWHYYSDGRIYNGTKTDVSEDGITWFTIFDSAISGTYAETAQGRNNKITVTTTHIVPSQYIDFPLGVFLLATPKRMDEENAVKREIEAYDGLLILIDDKLQSTYTITAGTNYKQAIIDLLATAGITQYIIEDTTKTLPITMAFDPGTSKLSVINSLINQINFTPIRVDVYGNFVTNSYIAPSSRGIEYTYSDDSMSVTYKGMTESLDLFHIPNNWVVVATNAETAPLKSVYTNSNASSITSTVSRGRTITDYREIDNIADQQSLDSYTLRIANEASQIYGYLEFDTAIMPMHDYQDLLNIVYSKLGINDKYIETEWSFDLETGAKMHHVVRKVVTI